MTVGRLYRTNTCREPADDSAVSRATAWRTVHTMAVFFVAVLSRGGAAQLAVRVDGEVCPVDGPPVVTFNR